jgi:hypothetical protein
MINLFIYIVSVNQARYILGKWLTLCDSVNARREYGFTEEPVHCTLNTPEWGCTSAKPFSASTDLGIIERLLK